MSSVKSVYTRVPPALLGMALRYGLRSRAQVKSFADLRSEPIDRARVLSGIVEQAPPKFRADTVRETVTAALAVENWKEKADVLMAVTRLEALPDDLVNRMISAIEADSWTGGADL